jgi:hypothetical protein
MSGKPLRKPRERVVPVLHHKEDLMSSQISKLACHLMGVGLICGMAASARAAGPESVVLQWNDTALQAIRDTHPGPPMCARDLAIVATCMYDAWAAYDPTAVGTRLGGTLRRPAAERTLANKNQAISFAAYRALADLFPQTAEVSMFTAEMHSLGYNPADPSTDPSTPSRVGNMAAQAVIEFRHHDGANQLGDLSASHVPYSDYTGYTPVNPPDQILDPNHWQPLRVSDGHGGFVIQNYIAPQWGQVIPFSLTSPSQFLPLDLPALSGSDEYVRQAQQLLEYSANLTDKQKVIAEYWADGPSSELPPGHWCLFAHFVSQRDHYSLDQDAKLFFALSNAVFDASIVAWDAKRVFDSVRPITAIQYLFKGQKVQAWAGPYKGTQAIDGGNWQPYQAATVVTPPFPEYISGHSTFSAAAAEILKRFTGSDAFGASYTQRAGSSRVEPGTTPATDITLSWATFTEAADEAGISRRYGGIHFEAGDQVGRLLGRQVGAQAWEKAQSYWNGTAGP